MGLNMAQVCEKYDISADTIRYYERVGAIPEISRTAGGQRTFEQEDLNWLENALCLRSAGVSMELVSKYVALCSSDTNFTQRKDLLIQARDDVESRIAELTQELKRLNHKIACYDRAIETGHLSWD